MSPQKDGASQPTGPAVCPPATGSHSCGQVSDIRAKMRALAQAMGAPCIVRTVDGGTHLLTVEALKFIPVDHGALIDG